MKRPDFPPFAGRVPGRRPRPVGGSRFVRAGGIQYHYEEYPGPGRDVVLLHGFASSSYTWEAVAPRLAERGFRVLALDMKGFGWSDKPASGAYDPVALMEGVKSWMDAVGLSRAAVVGNSLGGAVASLMALVHPERVSGLVLVNSLMPYDIPYPLILRLARAPLAPALAGRVITRGVIRRNLKQVFHDRRLVTEEKVSAYWERLRAGNGLRAQALVARALSPEPFLSYLSRAEEVRTPALAIWGREDRWIPLSFGRRMAREGCGPRNLVVLDHCGHMPQEEKPRETARLMARFLAGRKIRETGAALPATAECMAACPA